MRLAAHAARELVAGRHVHTHELVVSLRDFIRQALDLEPIPTGLEFPCRDRLDPVEVVVAQGNGSVARGRKVAGVEVSAEEEVVVER